MYSNNNNSNNNNESQKLSGKTFLRDFNAQFEKINLLLRKKAVLHTTSLMHCKARHVLCDPLILISTNYENASEMTFVAGTTKINLKKMKT